MEHIKKIIAFTLVALVVAVLAIAVWEFWVEEPLTNALSSETITVEREVEEASEYELWLAASTTQQMLDLQFKTYKRDALNREITELSSKR